LWPAAVVESLVSWTASSIDDVASVGRDGTGVRFVSMAEGSRFGLLFRIAEAPPFGGSPVPAAAGAPSVVAEEFVGAFFSRAAEDPRRVVTRRSLVDRFSANITAAVRRLRSFDGGAFISDLASPNFPALRFSLVMAAAENDALEETRASAGAASATGTTALCGDAPGRGRLRSSRKDRATDLAPAVVLAADGDAAGNDASSSTEPPSNGSGVLPLLPPSPATPDFSGELPMSMRTDPCVRTKGCSTLYLLPLIVTVLLVLWGGGVAFSENGWVATTRSC
jgi:hypothetical protein